MESQRQVILAFDAYGTLLSTESISKQLATHFGHEKAATIAREWRKYQLEYTWRLNSMNKYEPFSTVTRRSLCHALAEAGVSLPLQDIESLMSSYNTLSLFPDVPPLFDHLQSSRHIYPVIFSNGTMSMISTTLSQSPEISPHAHLFKDIVVVEPIQKFKPCPEVYEHLCVQVGKEGKGEEKDVWLISSNPFDIVGANACGLSTCWVDRSGLGWVDSAMEGDEGKPNVIVSGLDEVVEKIGRLVR